MVPAAASVDRARVCVLFDYFPFWNTILLIRYALSFSPWLYDTTATTTTAERCSSQRSGDNTFAASSSTWPFSLALLSSGCLKVVCLLFAVARIHRQRKSRKEKKLAAAVIRGADGWISSHQASVLRMEDVIGRNASVTPGAFLDPRGRWLKCCNFSLRQAVGCTGARKVTANKQFCGNGVFGRSGDVILFVMFKIEAGSYRTSLKS